LPNPALRGSIRPAPGLGVLLTPCVIHWRLKRRRFGLGAWTSMAMAALGGAGLAGERREGHSGRGLWCKGSARARAGSGRTQARVTRGWGGLQKAWPWRSGGGGNAGGGALPTKWPTAQLSWRKRRHGSPGGSPRGCGGRSCGAGWSSAKSGRWSRAALAEKVAVEVGVECSGPGEAPEVEAEPVRSSAGAPVWRSGVAAAA